MWRVSTCGALGKIANCQVAVTAALWTAARAWMTGALLYLPKPWLTDADRRKLAARACRLGRRALREVATIVTPDTPLRWHRQPIARKWTYAKSGTRRRSVLAEIRQLVGRIANENPTWGYTRIQGALKNLGHHVGRSTIARILRTQGISPVPERPTSWQTFLRAHWGAIAGADFFTCGPQKLDPGENLGVKLTKAAASRSCRTSM